MTARIVEVRQAVLKKNDLAARALRARWAGGPLVVSLVSSPGAGKTTLLAATLARLRAEGAAVAALVGDLATDRDARALAATGAPARQITTGTVCHLDAEMVAAHLDGWPPATGDGGEGAVAAGVDTLDYLFIENVGNLVCPSSYDLGEDLRAVLLSVTEGEDKPLKYPTIFNTSDLALITKTDLAAAAGFDRAAALANLEAVRPGMAVLEVSAKSGAGMEAWLELLRTRQPEKARRASITAAP
jgi:hydrogenase nickel incorporation protein HypB